MVTEALDSRASTHACIANDSTQHIALNSEGLRVHTMSMSDDSDDELFEKQLEAKMQSADGMLSEEEDAESCDPIPTSMRKKTETNGFFDDDDQVVATKHKNDKNALPSKGKQPHGAHAKNTQKETHTFTMVNEGVGEEPGQDVHPADVNRNHVAGLVSATHATMDPELAAVVPSNIHDLKEGNSNFNIPAAARKYYLVPNRCLKRIGHLVLNGEHKKANKYWPNKVPMSAVTIIDGIKDEEHGMVSRWFAIYRSTLTEPKLLPQAKVNEIVALLESRDEFKKSCLCRFIPKGDNQKINVELQGWDVIKPARAPKRSRSTEGTSTQPIKHLLTQKQPDSNEELAMAEYSDDESTNKETTETNSKLGQVEAAVETTETIEATENPRQEKPPEKQSVPKRQRPLKQKEDKAASGDHCGMEWLGSVKCEPGSDVVTRISSDGSTVSIYQINK